MKRSALSVCVCAELDGTRVSCPMDSTHYGALRLYSGMPAKVVYVKSVLWSAYAYPYTYRRVCANIPITLALAVVRKTAGNVRALYRRHSVTLCGLFRTGSLCSIKKLWRYDYIISYRIPFRSMRNNLLRAGIFSKE